MSKRFASIFLSFILFAAPLAAEVRLLMADEAGCVWCAAWDREIGPIYPKSPEGEAAPLMRIDIAELATTQIAFDRPVVYTPTFVLVIDGAEVDRLEGYPGQDFFWVLVSRMLSENDISTETLPAATEAEG